MLKNKKSKILILSFLLLSVICFSFSAARAQETDSDKKEQEELSLAVGAFENGFYDTSLNLLNKFISRFPQSALSPEADLYIGRCYFNQKKYAPAIEQFNRLLDGEPRGRTINLKDAAVSKDKIYYWLAESYLRSQDMPSALNFYEKLTLECLDSAYLAQAYYSLGWCLFEQGKFKEAQDKFSAFKDKFPGNLLVREADYKIAECLYSLKDYSQLKSYAEYLEKNYYLRPNSAQSGNIPEVLSDASGKRLIKFYLAESGFYLKDYPYAIDNYIQALAQDSDDDFKNPVYLGLGWSYLKSGDYASALMNFDKPLSAESGGYFENALLGRALALGMSLKFPEAIENYDKLISRSKDAAIVLEAYIGKAEALYNQGDYSQSISAYKEAEGRINPEVSGSFSDRISYGLGLSYLKSGNTGQALKEFSLLAQNSKDDSLKVSALTEMAEVFLESGDNKKAIGIYEGILKDYPDCANCGYVYSGLGLALLKSREYGRAIEVLKSAIAKYSESPARETINFYLGTAYYEQGDFLNSYMQLRSFVTRYPRSAHKARALNFQGLSLKSLGRFQDAYEIFKQAAKLDAQDAKLSARAEFEMADCLYSLGRIEEALSKLEYLRSKYSSSEVSSAVLWRLAEHYFQENKLDLSRRYLLDIIQSGQDPLARDDAYYLLGRAFEKDGRYEEALEAFKKIERDKQKVYPKIADIYKSSGNFLDAASYYRKVLQEGGSENKAQARFGLAECLEEAGLLDEAVLEYRAISSEADKDILVKGLLRAGKIYEDKEDIQKAVEMYEKIVSLDVEESKFAQERLLEIQKTLNPKP
ncbi:MAG: tetratricopeptide repeat protein [Candidatus Omnitrophota bacterium]|nr:tetratricopeptide repeat protein [Candidatus Omnitrophota bacterium]